MKRLFFYIVFLLVIAGVFMAPVSLYAQNTNSYKGLKKYVDDNFSSTASVLLKADKSYVDDTDNVLLSGLTGKLNLSGGTLSGDLLLSGNRIIQTDTNARTLSLSCGDYNYLYMYGNAHATASVRGNTNLCRYANDANTNSGKFKIVRYAGSYITDAFFNKNGNLNLGTEDTDSASNLYKLYVNGNAGFTGDLLLTGERKITFDDSQSLVIAGTTTKQFIALYGRDNSYAPEAGAIKITSFTGGANSGSGSLSFCGNNGTTQTTNGFFNKNGNLNIGTGTTDSASSTKKVYISGEVQITKGLNLGNISSGTGSSLGIDGSGNVVTVPSGAGSIDRSTCEITYNCTGNADDVAIATLINNTLTGKTSAILHIVGSLGLTQAGTTGVGGSGTLTAPYYHILINNTSTYRQLTIDWSLAIVPTISASGLYYCFILHESGPESGNGVITHYGLRFVASNYVGGIRFGSSLTQYNNVRIENCLFNCTWIPVSCYTRYGKIHIIKSQIYSSGGIGVSLAGDTGTNIANGITVYISDCNIRSETVGVASTGGAVYIVNSMVSGSVIGIDSGNVNSWISVTNSTILADSRCCRVLNGNITLVNSNLSQLSTTVSADLTGIVITGTSRAKVTNCRIFLYTSGNSNKVYGVDVNGASVAAELSVDNTTICVGKPSGNTYDCYAINSTTTQATSFFKLTNNVFVKQAATDDTTNMTGAVRVVSGPKYYVIGNTFDSSFAASNGTFNYGGTNYQYMTSAEGMYVPQYSNVFSQDVYQPSID